MDESKRNEFARMAWVIHGAVEEAYLSHPATKDTPGEWHERQRLLLADMAIHLLQTAIKSGPMDLGQLRNNLHAILTIGDQFLPHAQLIGATDRLYDDA